MQQQHLLVERIPRFTPIWQMQLRAEQREVICSGQRGTHHSIWELDSFITHLFLLP
jgi:hypothetical protein